MNKKNYLINNKKKYLLFVLNEFDDFANFD